ncbi:hypothetical protein GPECTOR_16g690 [Gonium pectorale]|uniref:Protein DETOXIFICATION n=1 Tax=Gonium pectorale TaxID=33097 RepID=A0A150GLA3_GONPE|nr:hypothetical protein GPECTOR_16g690 [Gonium pectorale]|eukprot:KXZ50515.1 hypothetical protein GPECTOR_16g690 [Gonium pectorale]
MQASVGCPPVGRAHASLPLGARQLPPWCQTKCTRPRFLRGTPAAPRAALSAAADAFGREPPAGGLLKGRLAQAQRLLTSPYDKEIAAVALPALVGLSLEPVVTAFNTSLVGHLGTHQLGAVSLGTIALNAVTFLFSFLLFLTVPEVAAATVKGDADEVSRVAARGIWIAAAAGVVSAAFLHCNASAVVSALKPPEPAVAVLATQYLKIRALGVPAALLGFVATGVFRGLKDTKTPLLGTGAMMVVSGALHVLLLNVFHMDVVGAALASTTALLAPVVVNLGALVARGSLQPRHLLAPPGLAEVLPLLQRGAVLAGKNMVTFGMILFASTLCVRCGAAFQASFEVTRQFWMLTMPFFECLNVATQSLCATYLGKEDRTTARAMLLRLLFLGAATGGVAGTVVWAAHEPFVALFTTDPQVVQHVVSSLPLICAFFAVDALGSIMDGSLLAAKQSNYMSAVQVAGSAVQYAALSYVASSGHVSTLGIWAAIKVMSMVRTVGGSYRNFMSARSAYRDPPGAAAGPSPVAAAPSSASEAAVGLTTASAASSAAAAVPAPPAPQATATTASDGQETLAADSAAAILHGDHNGNGGNGNGHNGNGHSGDGNGVGILGDGALGSRAVASASAAAPPTRQ